MLSLFRRKKEDGSAVALTWHAQATEALEQAVAGAPVPSLLKKRLRKELTSAAEAHARKHGRSEVSPEDLMQGLLSKMPAEMKNRIMQAARKGPQGLQLLQKQLQQNQKKKS